MTELEEIKVEFADDPMQEHINLLQAKTQFSVRGWLLGVRLLHARDTRLFMRVEIDGRRPRDWTDYLKNFLDLSLDSSYHYMQCARWDRSHTIRWGIEKVYWLTQVTDLTVVDETMEEALALELPLPEGGTKKAELMSAKEIETAYKLMKDKGAEAKRPPAAGEDHELRRLTSLTTNVLQPYMKPSQIRLYKKDGVYLADLRQTPIAQIRDIGAALTRIPA